MTFFILAIQFYNCLIIYLVWFCFVILLRRFIPSLQRAAPFCNTESNENQTSNKVNISNKALIKINIFSQIQIYACMHDWQL